MHRCPRIYRLSHLDFDCAASTDFPIYVVVVDDDYDYFHFNANSSSSMKLPMEINMEKDRGIKKLL